MNANRMKYATTPTYGMQRRGMFKKPEYAYQAPSSPDFALATEQSEVPQPFVTVSQPGAMQPMFQQSASPYPQPPYFPQNLSMPSMQAINPSPAAPQLFAQQSVSRPSAQPPFMPQGFPLQQTMPPQPPMPGFMPPLGNSAPPVNPMGSAFSSRNQGYVPPTASQPMVQSAPFAGTSQQLMGGVPLAGAPAAPVPPMPGMQPPPLNPLFAAEPVKPQPQNQVYPFAAPVIPPKQREPMDASKIWSIFLYGVLPALFVACLFIPESANFVRYIFLALCVCGLGAMWYRQMFSSSTRMIMSVVYVALCIVAIAMSMQGSRDVQQTLNPVNPQSQQSTPVPRQQPANPAPAVTEAPAYSEPTPAAPSQAELRLSTFMSLWMSMNTPEMVSYVQPSWASAQDNPSSQLFMVLANRTPESFDIEEISGVDDDSSRTVTMTAVINKNNGKEPVMYRFMVIMVKEGGEWYVDPNSLATSDDIKPADENVVNANQGGLSTEPPRSTVSPAPPADTKLYYNPDGGHYYHIDPNCPGVKSEYLPLQGSFLYNELSAYKKNLTPCLKCGAPTKELEDAQ